MVKKRLRERLEICNKTLKDNVLFCRILTWEQLNMMAWKSDRILVFDINKGVRRSSLMEREVELMVKYLENIH